MSPLQRNCLLVKNQEFLFVCIVWEGKHLYFILYFSAVNNTEHTSTAQVSTAGILFLFHCLIFDDLSNFNETHTGCTVHCCSEKNTQYAVTHWSTPALRIQ